MIFKQKSRNKVNIVAQMADSSAEMRVPPLLPVCVCFVKNLSAALLMVERIYNTVDHCVFEMSYPPF